MKNDPTLRSKSGIYQIRNLINNKVYIGRSNCMYRRCSSYIHSFKYKKKKEINTHLMRALVKYGIENFKFEVLEFCPVNITPEKEHSWMMIKGSLDRSKGYNLKSDLKGKIFTSQETKVKISKSIKEKWKDVNYKKLVKSRLSEAWSKNNDRKKNHIENSRLKLSKYKYIIHVENMYLGEFNYSQLVNLNLDNVWCMFSYHQSNKVKYRMFTIEKVKL